MKAIERYKEHCGSYEETVRFLEEIPRFTKKTSLTHTKKLLAALGNPEENFKIFHVAGTNGKGSVCAYLASALRAAGFSVGLFTSPHLIRVNERFRFNRIDISDTEFVHCFRRVMEAAERLEEEETGFLHPTYFEILFLMGMVFFSEKNADYVVLETGLGGRLDATNAVSSPEAVVITSVSLDHMQYLGSTVSEIAREKAGIIKSGIPVFYDGTSQEASAVISDTARRLSCPCTEISAENCRMLERKQEGISFLYRMASGEEGEETAELFIRNRADYQMVNAALAFRAVKHATGTEAAQKGIADTIWHGRMEEVYKDVYIDGAHNADGIAQFIRNAAAFSKGRSCGVLFSAFSDHDYRAMIQRIARGLKPSFVVTTSTDEGRSVDPQVLSACFREYIKADVKVIERTEDAFAYACKVKEDGILFCIGSLYQAGRLLHLIGQQEKTASDMPS